jgi:uncharacterized protein YeaO (DUF488 family)
MKTSSFARYRGYTKVTTDYGVSIARETPAGFRGTICKKLAPDSQLFREFKAGLISEEAFVKRYYREVLKDLDPQEIYDELGDNAVLLCWEPKGQFCHRRLFATWLEIMLGIEILEL